MGQEKKIEVFTDGAARGNPGPAAIAYSIYDESGRCLESGASYIGKATNNEAEYRALLLAIDKACNHSKDTIIFHLDSELVVRQVNGDYRAKDERMRNYLEEVLSKLKGFKRVRMIHVPRENGRIMQVDKMVNDVLDHKGFKK